MPTVSLTPYKLPKLIEGTIIFNEIPELSEANILRG